MKRYSLTILFVITAIIATGVAALVVNNVIGRHTEAALQAIATQATISDADHIQTMIWARQSEHDVMVENMHDATHAAPGMTLDQVIAPEGLPSYYQHLVDGLTIAQFNVLNLRGEVVWSTNPAVIGVVNHGSPLFQGALAGNPTSKMERNKTLTDISGTTRELDVVETYVPLRQGPDGEIIGVIELYRDVTEDVSVLVSDTRSTVLWTTLATMGALFASLLGFILVANLMLNRSKKRDVTLAETEARLAERERSDVLEREKNQQLWESEARARSIIETAQDAFIAMDEGGSIIEWNLQAETLFGWSRSEVLGQKVRDTIIPSQYLDANHCSVEYFLTRNEGSAPEVRPELLVLRRDGQEFYAEASISAVEIGSKRVFNAFIRDVTKRREVLEEVRRLALAVEQTRNGVATMDLDGDITFANPAMERMFGYEPGEMLGMGVRSLHAESERDSVAREIFEATMTGGWSGPPIVMQRKAGEEFFCKFHTSIMKDSDGQPVGMVVIASDVTENMMAQEALRASQKEAVTALEELRVTQESLVQAEKLSAIGELVAGVAHELNNPLTGVVGFSELLLRTDLTPEVRGNVEHIALEANRASTIVQNLLSFARKQRGAHEPVDLNDLIRAAAEMKGHELQVSNIQLVLDPAEDLPAVLGDYGQIQSVVMNLITNAQDAIVETHGSGVVEIKTMRVDETVRITVTDDGPGVKPEHLHRLFDPFFTTKGVSKGTGLGLSICHGIVTRHQGRMWVESKYGEGCTFIVEFPAASEKEKVMRTEESQQTFAPQGARALVIDDEESVRSLLVKVLSTDGYEVENASGGQQALDILDKAEFDVILVDMKMPGMSGQEFYNQLVERKPKMASQTLFVTGDTIDPDTAEFLDRSGRSALAKPFSLEELEKMVADIVTAPSK